MNQAIRVTGELTGPISTTATVVDAIGGDGTGIVPSAYPVIVNPQQTSGPSPMGLLKALKRRLALALGLAIPVWCLFNGRLGSTSPPEVPGPSPGAGEDVNAANHVQDHRRRVGEGRIPA